MPDRLVLATLPESVAQTLAAAGVAAFMVTNTQEAVALRDAEGVGDFASLTAFDDFDADKVRSRARVTRELRHAYSDVRTLMLGESRRKGGLLDQLADIVDDGLAVIDSFDTRV